MATRVGFIIFALFISLLLLCNSNEAFATRSNGTKPKPFEFLNHLKGCHKGETLKGVHNLKLYLKRFGYLEYDSSNNAHADDDEFDEVVESAVKTYQTNYNLKATGTLDTKTVNQMTMPRCGVPDVINGTTWMRSGKRKLVHERHHHKSSKLHTISHYSFFPRSPRWPDNKTHLTYAFDPSAREDILGPICARAFQRWSSVTQFTFEEITDFMTSDLAIGAYTGDHGDGASFDGTGRTLAHAFAPTIGMFHYDADESWSDGPVSGSHDLETVALHEIGHLLGLEHSSVVDAIMYPSIPAGVRKDQPVLSNKEKRTETRRAERGEHFAGGGMLFRCSLRVFGLK